MGITRSNTGTDYTTNKRIASTKQYTIASTQRPAYTYTSPCLTQGKSTSKPSRTSSATALLALQAPHIQSTIQSQHVFQPLLHDLQVGSHLAGQAFLSHSTSEQRTPGPLQQKHSAVIFNLLSQYCGPRGPA